MAGRALAWWTATLLTAGLAVTEAPMGQERREGAALAQTWPPGRSASRSSVTGSGFACTGKRYCREMASCAEARFNLTQCGASQLDRDRDGIPCESICR